MGAWKRPWRRNVPLVQANAIFKFTIEKISYCIARYSNLILIILRSSYYAGISGTGVI